MFIISSIIQALIWVSKKKKNDKEAMICMTPKSNKKILKWLDFLCLLYTKQRTFFVKEKAFQRKLEWTIEQKNKKKA